MSTQIIATNGFMALVWVLVAIAFVAVVGPEITDASDDPESRAMRDAIVGPGMTVALLFAASYTVAAVGVGFEQPWGDALTMAMLGFTAMIILTIPIAIWQMVVLLRKKPA